MKSPIYPILTVLTILIFSCAKRENTTNDEQLATSIYEQSDESLDLDTIQVKNSRPGINCNRNFQTSLNILDYVPSLIKNEEELSTFVSNSLYVWYSLHYKMDDNYKNFRWSYGLGNNYQDNQIYEKINKEHAAMEKVFSTKIFHDHMLFTFTGPLDIKNEYYSYKKTYSKEYNDSLSHVFHYINLFAIREYLFIKLEHRRINNSTSIRTKIDIPENIYNDTNFVNCLHNFEDLNRESNIIAALLFLNRINGVKCENLADDVNKLKEYFNGKSIEHSTRSGLFENFTKKLRNLKKSLNHSKFYFDRNSNKLSDHYKLLIANKIEMYNICTNELISSLDIYNKMPIYEKELTKRIKEGSEVFFE